MIDRGPETITAATIPPPPRSMEPGKRPLDVPFDVPGTDVAFFNFGLVALEAFETALAPAGGLREPLFGIIERQLLAGSPKMVRMALDYGLKTVRDGKAVPLEIDLDEPPFAIGPAVEAALNALAISIMGKSYADLIAEATADAQARAAEARKAWEDSKTA